MYSGTIDKLTIDYDSDLDISTVAFPEEISLEEIKSSLLKIWHDDQISKKKVIWDLRKQKHPFDKPDLIKLANFVKANSNNVVTKAAYVVPGELHFGMTRMYYAWREDENIMRNLFRNIDEAREWLAQ